MSNFAKTARKVYAEISSTRVATTDRDAEWQRVNSYIADVLKDSHVLYAKLARLQGDFGGAELDNLEKISEYVLEIGGKLSAFSKAFYEGRADIANSESFGTPEGGEQAPPKPAADLSDLGGDKLPTPTLDAGVESLSETPPKAPETQPEAPPKEDTGEEPEIDFDYSEEESDED